MIELEYVGRLVLRLEINLISRFRNSLESIKKLYTRNIIVYKME